MYSTNTLNHSGSVHVQYQLSSMFRVCTRTVPTNYCSGSVHVQCPGGGLLRGGAEEQQPPQLAAHAPQELGAGAELRLRQHQGRRRLHLALRQGGRPAQLRGEEPRPPAVFLRRQTRSEIASLYLLNCESAGSSFSWF